MEENKKKMALKHQNGEPTTLGYIITGIIVVLLIALGIFILYQAFFGSQVIKIIFWSIVGIFTVVGAFYGIGRLIHWLIEEYG